MQWHGIQPSLSLSWLGDDSQSGSCGKQVDLPMYIRSKDITNGHESMVYSECFRRQLTGLPHKLDLYSSAYNKKTKLIIHFNTLFNCTACDVQTLINFVSHLHTIKTKVCPSISFVTIVTPSSPLANTLCINILIIPRKLVINSVFGIIWSDCCVVVDNVLQFEVSIVSEGRRECAR